MSARSHRIRFTAVTLLAAVALIATPDLAACGACSLPAGSLKTVHPRSLEVAVAIRRDIEEGVLEATPADAVPRILGLRMRQLLSKTYPDSPGTTEILLIETGSRFQIGTAGSAFPSAPVSARSEPPATKVSIRWITGHAVLQALLAREMTVSSAVKRGLIIVEIAS